MSDVEQQETTTTPLVKKRRMGRSIVLTLGIVVLLLVSAVLVMFSTDRGSKFLLDRVLEQQKIISYQYESGNLLHGIILKNIWVNLKAVDVKIDRADVTLGWRAVIHKEIHLHTADVKNLQIIYKKPPSNKEFQFAPIRLPFALYVDRADLDHLLIKTSKAAVDFYDIQLNEASWLGTELKFTDSRMDMGYLAVRNASGMIRFDGKYPLHAVGDVNLPALRNLNIHDIRVVAKGSLDTIAAGVETYTPDLLTGWIVLHPVRQGVPMFGQVKFKDYEWPLLLEQKLFTKNGLAKFQANTRGMDIQVQSDLSGKYIPRGQYQAQMHTDYVRQLDVQSLTGQVMSGTVKLAGILGWKDAVTWKANGRIERLNPKDKIIPQVIRDFMPPTLDANIASSGTLANGLQVKGQIDFDRYENWSLTLNQAQQTTAKAKPMFLDIGWQGIDRAVPYIGWLSSDSGQLKMTLLPGRQDMLLSSVVRKHQQGRLPTGHYQARLNLNNNRLNIPAFTFQQEQQRVTGTGSVILPSEKRQLQWNADLQAKDFDLQTVVAQAPVNHLNGRVKVHAYAKPNQHIIQLNEINLTGQLVQTAQQEQVQLVGRSTIVLLFQDPKAGGQFKSFAVNYDGSLNGIQHTDGLLKLQIAGTPSLIQVRQLQHSGVAGKIYAQGMVNLQNGIGWDLKASLVHFKPQYFVASLTGDLSGNIRTQGNWGEQLKRINIEKLNVAGTLNNKPLRGRGNLTLLLDSRQQGFLPQQFEARNLYLVYANNQIQATGNTQSLKVKINAPALNQLYSGLRGRAYGNLDVQSVPRLKATANLAVDNFGFNELFSVKKLRVQGELPTAAQTPSLLTAKLEQFRSGKRSLDAAEISLAGTRQAHLVRISAQNRLSKFYVQLAGGFNPQNDWLGQIQKGDFDSYRIHLVQQQNAPLLYSKARASLFIGQHCWTSPRSQICLDQSMRVSRANGNVSLVSQNLDLQDFQAFVPEGLALTGKLNGYAKASWSNGNRPKLDARLVTRKGEIGLAPDDPQDPAMTMNYDELSLIGKSVAEGLLLRLDVKTPNIGTGYANVVIDPYQAAKPMRGEVAFSEVQLAVFKPFIRDVRSMGGTLSFAGKVNGTLTNPLLNGEMRLKNGAISMLSLPVNLSNVQVYSSIRQNSATIKGAFNSGPGVGLLNGEINWQDKPRIRLSLKGENLVMRQAPLITASVTPELNMEVLPADRRLTVNGKIDIPRALISMPQASAPIVNVSSDVRIIREGQNQLAILRAAKPWDIRADLQVNLGDRVIFQGFDSRIPLIGRLYLSQRGTETAMRASGAIGVSQRVKIEAYGQSLDLNRAIARFNGPASNPTLDIDANKMVQGSLVGIRVTGTAASPNIQVYNDAGLSEQEALNAMITGRINEGTSGLSQTESFKSDVNNTIAAAGISLGLGGTRALTNQIGRSFGLSGLALDAQGTGDDTQVSLTGYLTPDLFIRYGVGVFTPVNKLTLRYQMNIRLYFEASQSLERAIDLFYHWRF